MASPSNRKPRSISHKMAVIVISVVLPMELLFTAVWGLLEYRNSRVTIEKSLEHIRNHDIPQIVQQLWVTNTAMVDTLLEAIVALEHIERVELEAAECPSVFAGKDSSDIGAAYRETLIYRYKEREIALGTLVLYTNENSVRQRIVADTLKRALLEAMTAIIIAAMLILHLNSILGKRITQLAQALKNDTQESLADAISPVTKRGGNDELQQLTDSINALRLRIHVYLAEKEMVFREAHHRIKNNMQSVEGMLALQARDSQDETIRAALNQSISRLHSMTVLYQKIYQSESIGEISTRGYLVQLTREILAISTLNAEEQERLMDLEIEEIQIPGKDLFSLGILVNELITNSLKYACPKQKGKCIRLSLTKRDEGGVLFRYHDNGPPIPPEAITGTAGGFGMLVIRQIGEQLGELAFDTQDGNLITLKMGPE